MVSKQLWMPRWKYIHVRCSQFLRIVTFVIDVSGHFCCSEVIPSLFCIDQWNYCMVYGKRIGQTLLFDGIWLILFP